MGLTALAAALVLLALCLGIWLWAIAPQLGARPDFTELRKYDYAHRGLHRQENGVPENSLLAFRLAADCGFGMELDLQLTKDHRVVVHHDATLARSCGAQVVISRASYEELRQYPLFNTQERIPLLSQVLEQVQGKVPLILELKSYGNAEKLCVLAMKELEGYRGLYCVESFDPRVVKWFREHYPQVIRGQLMRRLQGGEEGLTALQAFFGRNLMTNFLTRPHFEAYDFTARNNLSLRAARRVWGMQEASWTLSSQEAYAKAKAEGCLCIFEGFLPAQVEEAQRKNLEELLGAKKAAALAKLYPAFPGKEAPLFQGTIKADD